MVTAPAFRQYREDGNMAGKKKSRYGRVTTVVVVALLGYVDVTLLTQVAESSVVLGPRARAARVAGEGYKLLEFEPEAALSRFEEAARMDPDEPRHHVAVAEACRALYAKRGFFSERLDLHDRAVTALRRARELAPSDYAIAERYAWEVSSGFVSNVPVDMREAYAAWQYCLDLPLSSYDGRAAYEQDRIHLLMSAARCALRLGDRATAEAHVAAADAIWPAPGRLGRLESALAAEDAGA